MVSAGKDKCVIIDFAFGEFEVRDDLLQRFHKES